MDNNTVQTAFGIPECYPYRSATCDEVTGYEDDGTPKHCGTRTVVAVSSGKSQPTVYKCRIHARDCWMEMAGLDPETGEKQ